VDGPRGRHRLSSGLAPTTKVTAGAVAGALVTVGVWLASFWHIEIPPEVSAAITMLATVVAAYLVPTAPNG
jgi:hypothetical protein